MLNTLTLNLLQFEVVDNLVLHHEHLQFPNHHHQRLLRIHLIDFHLKHHHPYPLPPTFTPLNDDDDDDRPLAQLHSLNTPPPSHSPILPPVTPSLLNPSQSFQNNSVSLSQPSPLLPPLSTPERTPVPNSPLLIPPLTPRLPPDSQTAAILANTLTACHITSPPQIPQPQSPITYATSNDHTISYSFDITASVTAISYTSNTNAANSTASFTSSRPLPPLSFIPSPISQPASPVEAFDVPEPQAFPRLLQPHQIRPRIFLSTNPTPRPLFPPQDLLPLSFINSHPTVSSSAQSTDSPFAALATQHVPFQPPSNTPLCAEPTLLPPDIPLSRSSMSESSDSHSNLLPTQPILTPSRAPHTPEPLVRTPPSPPTLSSADPPTPQSNPHVNSITTRATLRAPARDSPNPSTPSRTPSDRSYSSLSQTIRTSDIYLPPIPAEHQVRLTRGQRILMHFYYSLGEPIQPFLADICRFVTLHCGFYVASMTADIIDTITRPLITPCVHLLIAYRSFDSDITNAANDIHAQLVPYVLRVITAFLYLLHVTIPCGIFAPLYSYMVDHRWIRSFDNFVSTFSSLLDLLCETLQSLHDEFIAPPGRTSFPLVIAFYKNFLHHEFRHLTHHYQFLFAQRAPNRGTSLLFDDIHHTPHFTAEQTRSAYIPRLAPQRVTIDEIALLSTISSAYAGPDLMHFYRPDYTLHVLPDRNPRTNTPFTPLFSSSQPNLTYKHNRPYHLVFNPQHNRKLFPHHQLPFIQALIQTWQLPKVDLLLMTLHMSSHLS